MQLYPFSVRFRFVENQTLPVGNCAAFDSVKLREKTGNDVHAAWGFVIRLGMQIPTMTLSIEAPLAPDCHRSRVAWQAQRFLSEAASQLGDLVRLSSHSQQQTWRQALHAVEQVSATLAQVARPPLRSRRYRYSLDWRRTFAAMLRERREERGLSRQQLAERCKLSIGTIRNIETLRVHPEIDTIERIVSVKELGLSLVLLGLPDRASEREASQLTPARADLRDHSG